MAVLQKIKIEKDDVLEKAIKYYSVFFKINDVPITKKEIELLAFASIRGGITSISSREEFVKRFDSSLASLENIKGKLVQKNLIVKIDKKLKVNPLINLDFKKRIILQIDLTENAESN
jgi:hypothetical protein